MLIFWRLILAHFLTDFTFQTNKIAQWKRKNIWGVLFHSGIFFVISIVLCLFSKNFSSISTEYLTEIWWKFPGWLSIFSIFIIHFGEDYYRIWTIKKGGSPDNLFFFLWDQFIHIVLIFLFSPEDSGKIFEEKIVIIAIGIVLVTHFSSILIYYLEEIIYGHEHILNRLKGKYYRMAERITIFISLLLPGLWWLMLIPVILLRLALNKIYPKNGYEFTKINILIGDLFAIFVGFIIRKIIIK